MEILLRLATAQDIAALIELQTRSMSKLLTPYYTAPQITAIVRSQITARSTEEICLIAELTGKIVGFAALLPTQGQISAVFVHPDFARQGVGTKLLVALEKYALSAKCRALNVMSSLTAVAFYQAQGYQILYKCGFWTLDRIWIPCVQLKKRLVPLADSGKINQKYQLAALVLLLIGVVILAQPDRNFLYQLPNLYQNRR